MSDIVFAALSAALWQQHKIAVARLEHDSYEPTRRDSVELLERLACHTKSVSVIATVNDKLVGFCLGTPLELAPDVGGVTDDKQRGLNNSLYAADTLVAARWRGKGVAAKLKQKQVELAKIAGYRFVTGRNRVGFADAMWRINQRLGAVVLQRMHNDYADDLSPNECIYYRIAL